jgi:hypothetical protein
MIQTGMIHHLQYRMDGARLRILGAIHQAADAGMNCRSRAHRARLNCSKQLAVDEPVITGVLSRFAQRHDFSMGGWIAVGEVPIPSPSNHSTIANHDRSHRHFARLQGALSAAQGFLHPQFVGGKFVRRMVVREIVVERQFSITNDALPVMS